MGASFQIIVDTEVASDQAQTVGQLALNWLKQQKIIGDACVGCTLDKPDEGFLPGPQAMQAVDETDLDDFFKLRTNAFHVIVGRTIFFAYPGPQLVRCPNCGYDAVANNKSSWQVALNAWKNEQPSGFQCKNCYMNLSVEKWIYDPIWAFGNLGLKFWNWPPLKSEFVEEMSLLLEHEITVVRGKL